MQTESHPRGHGSLLVASLWQTANVSWDSDSSYKILLKFYPKKRTKVGDCENQRRFSRSGSQGMIHAQCEEMGKIGTSGKNLGMTRQQLHMEKDECVLAHITHQTGREHPQGLQTNMHGPESWSQTQLSPGALPSPKCSTISYRTPCSET